MTNWNYVPAGSMGYEEHSMASEIILPQFNHEGTLDKPEECQGT